MVVIFAMRLTSIVTSREGRVSRNTEVRDYFKLQRVTSREGRVSRNRRI